MKTKFPIYLESSRIFSNSNQAANLNSKTKIGENKSGIIIYSPYEAFYLLEEKKAEIISKNKSLKQSEAIKRFSKNKNFLTNYLVFRDLTKKGYLLKTGLKFGEEFRVYQKKEKHAKWLVFPVSQKDKINPKDLASKNRIAHTTGKRLLLALIDSQEDITYLEINWTKP